MGQRVESVGTDAEYIQENNSYGDKDNQEVIADFLHFQSLLDLAEKEQIVGVEVDAEQDHKNGDDPLDIDGIAGDTAVFDPETACARSAESGAQGVEQRHSAEQQKRHLQHGHAKIDQVEETRCIADLGDKLADGGAGTLGTHQIDVGSAAHRHDGEQEYEHAHAADPVSEAAPEQGTV